MLFRQIFAVLVLPVTVTVVIPAVLMGAGTAETAAPVRVIAILLAGTGVALAVGTIRRFVTRGRGTLAPWDPPRKLVVSGVYRYVRNPMISGILLILIGESLWFASWRIAMWAVVFFGINAVYIPLVEEKALHRRFGAEYDAYRQNVPRWIPRRSPWDAA